MENIKKVLARVMIIFFNLLPIKQNKIFFYSYYGSHYGCNPKYIAEYMLTHHPSEFDIVWAFNDPKVKGNTEKYRQVRIMSWRYFYELCTSKVIITNFRTTDLFIKRKKQYYIQTWHSSLRLKQIEKDAEKSLPPSYVDMAKQDSQKCDLLLSGCQFSTSVLERSFWYTGEILKSGTPRNDLFFQDQASRRRKIMRKLDLSKETKVLLYAPTFRQENNLDVYDVDYLKLVESLEQRFGGEWIILIKLHPHLIAKSSQLMYSDKVMNVSAYDDIQELLYIADILLSDYSSLIFDYAITAKPCFLYVPDLNEYQQTDRGLYFNVSDLPFISANTNEQLLDKIEQFNQVAYQANLALFLKSIGSYEEGNANELLLKRINTICFGEEKGDINEAV